MKLGVLSLLTLAILTLTHPLQAKLIIYTETGILSGTIGGASFTNSAVTLTTIADTDNIFHESVPSVYEAFMNTGLTTIEIDGVGKAEFSGNNFGVFSQYVVSKGISHVGIGDIAIMDAILYVLNTSAPPIYQLSSDFTTTALGKSLVT